MAYTNKTYVCFDGDSDMHYYRLMCAWKQHDSIPFTFYNAHDLNTARDSSQEESIKRQLRLRLQNSKALVVLVGDRTRYLMRFVRWEMEQAIALGMPIIAANLNGMRMQDPDRCPPILRSALAIHISFNARMMQFALENWPQSCLTFSRDGRTGPYYYQPETYRGLGL